MIGSETSGRIDLAVVEDEVSLRGGRNLPSVLALSYCHWKSVSNSDKAIRGVPYRGASHVDITLENLTISNKFNSSKSTD